MEFVEFWKIIPVFAQRKELILNSRNLEMGKEQCSSYCIFRSSREGYWRNGKKKIFARQELEWLLPISSTGSRPSVAVVIGRKQVRKAGTAGRAAARTTAPARAHGLGNASATWAR